MLGHGGREFYGPDYLLDHDVIFVSGNYRLGLLGFLSTEDKHCTGNFALKDQSFLLQWVQDNIKCSVEIKIQLQFGEVFEMKHTANRYETLKNFSKKNRLEQPQFTIT